MPDTDRFRPPIVLLRTANTSFCDYLRDMLCTEGLPWNHAARSWDEAEALRGTADVLIVPAGESDAERVKAWLAAGRTVVAIRPTAPVAELIGLHPAGGTVKEAPLTLRGALDCGTARAHGEADLYELRGGSKSVLADLSHAGTTYPAIAYAPCGTGYLVVFTYDLPRSVALTRQGNPEWTDGRGTDFGSDTFRPHDLFIRGCGAQTWLDFPSAGAPLADAQQRLLAALVTALSRNPVPRLWYLPDAKRTVLSILGDSDAASPEVISEQLDDVAAAGGRMSTFMIDYSVDSTSAEDVARWRAAGHEISVHPDYALHGDKSRPDAETMGLTLSTIIGRFRERFGYAPRTVRNHSVCWVPYAQQAEVERSLDIRMNSSYVYSSAFASPPYNGPMVGYMNGSGQPQKFVDENGCLFDIYQLGAHVCDEMLKSVYVGADAETAWQHTQALIDESIKRWHSFLGLSFHPVTYHANPEAKTWLRDRILPYARRREIPVWSAEMVLDFADARRACRLEAGEWQGQRFMCRVHCPPGRPGLTMMMPCRTGTRQLTSLVVNGGEVTGTDIALPGGRWRLALLRREVNDVMGAYS